MSRNRRASSLPLIVSTPTSLEGGMCVILGIPPLCENSPKRLVVFCLFVVSKCDCFALVSLVKLLNKLPSVLIVIQRVIFLIRRVSYREVILVNFCLVFVFVDFQMHMKNRTRFFDALTTLLG